MNRVLLLAVLTWISFFPLLSHADDSLWQEGVKALSENHPEEAIKVFEDWISQAPHHAAIPAAHRNLALAHWKAHHPALATLSLLSALKYATFPWQISSDLTRLNDTQLAVGATLPLSQNMGWVLHWYLQPNLLYLLAAVALCLFSLSGLLFFLQKRVLAKVVLGTICVATTLVAIAFSLRSPASVAVLAASPTPVWKNPSTEMAEERLVELPEGLLVQIKKEENGFRQIESPLVGWIAAEDLAVPSN